MLRHQGQRRTFKHNLRLAVLLSLAAGIVNVAGFMSFSIYTTNVTGHVAHFAKELSEGNFYLAKIIALWMFLFFLGAFFSSTVIYSVGKRKPRFSHSIPLLIEAFILLYVGYSGQNDTVSVNRNYFLSGSLLFAMGMQNAMVSIVSGFVVRTTHLTGMFTDLGIELSRLFQSSKEEKTDLNKKIILHFSIIMMFIIGGVVGGFMYHQVQFKIFIIAAVFLILALFYDSMRVAMLKFFQKINKNG